MADPAEVVTVALTDKEDTFCLAVLECGGNLPAAYRQVYGEDVSNPGARARGLLSRPEIAKRIYALQDAIQEHAYISLGSHLGQLAEIRDLAIKTDQLKTALGAEKARGEAAGFYSRGPSKPGDGSPPAAVVNIHMGSSPASVSDWSTKHGRPPVIIENPT